MPSLICFRAGRRLYLLRWAPVPGEPLALLCPPSAIYLVAWLGAVRLGALPMALHTRESAATLAAVCRKMGPRLLVYDASMENLAAGIAAACPQLTACVEALSAVPPTAQRNVFSGWRRFPATLARHVLILHQPIRPRTIRR